jgi:DNA-binding transcriptional MerR regulator
VSTTFPGTTIEISTIKKESSKVLFDGIFTTGGITLSQVSIMTGLEPYLIQNWVKRGFLTSPINRVYSKQQFARVIIINMLRESLQIEKICRLLQAISGEPNNKSDDLIGDDELYHRYVDMLSVGEISLNDHNAILRAAEDAAAGFKEPWAGGKKQLVRILQVMLYAHAASKLRETSEKILSTLE